MATTSLQATSSPTTVFQLPDFATAMPFPFGALNQVIPDLSTGSGLSGAIVLCPSPPLPLTVHRLLLHLLRPQTHSACFCLGPLHSDRKITSKIPNMASDLTSFKSVQISFLNDNSCVHPEAGPHLDPFNILLLPHVINAFSYLCFLSQCLVNAIRPGILGVYFFFHPPLFFQLHKIQSVICLLKFLIT